MLTMSNASIAWAAQDDKESSDIATADASLSQAPSNAPRDVYMVLAGGASLGSYEAGYVATAVQFLREHMDTYHLRGISGTSAGGINAFAGALEYCREIPDHTPSSRTEPDSVPYQTWMPIGWPMIYDENKVTRAAIFHTDDLIKHGVKLLASSTLSFRKNCRIPIRVAVTRESEDPMGSSPEQTLQMIEYIGVEMRTGANARPQYYPLPPRAIQPPHHVTPWGTPNKALPLEDVMRMITASAAFPMGFAPVTMKVNTERHTPSGANIVTVNRTYYDGGIFENIPVQSIFPEIETTQPASPLVMIVDLQNPRVPDTVPKIGTDNDNMGGMTQKWMRYARSRAYAEASSFLRDRDIETWRAQQRYPVAGSFLGSFADFLDLSFRKTDYLLGVYDARQDLQHNTGLPADKLPASGTQAQCLEQLLHDHTAPSCVQADLSDNIIATLRGLVAAGNTRCKALPIPSMGCASFAEEKLDDRLPQPEQHAGQLRRQKRHTQTSHQEDLAAFLHELTRGDFLPSLSEDWTELSQHLSKNPGRLYARVIEDGLHAFAKQQATSTIRAELAFDAILQSALPIAPRTSLSALIGLHGIETTVNIPISKRLSMDVGGTAEWGIAAGRQKKWHLFSGGPVMRFGVNLTDSQTMFALFADMHAGVLFGPTFDNVVNNGEGVGFSRSKTIPHAAVFIGVAPRIFVLRRLQLDLPIRAYWLCANAGCTAFVDKKPAYGIALRVGWNWTTSAKVR